MLKTMITTAALLSLTSGIAMADCNIQSDTDVNANKALVLGFYDTINAEDWEKVATFLHDDFLFYPQVDRYYEGAEGFIDAEKKNFDAFDNWSMPIVEMTAEYNRVATYHVVEGTHVRPIMGLEPSGNQLRFSLLMMLTIKDGKIIEKRAHYDRMDISEQLGSEDT
ncbi:ester cyclase [Halomonas ramblicola]|uniref:ester cyclase n=1 Tax=Halomonas ramblicola TaxID=747349 RepID=UPI0025B4E9B8|nr:ester cyclase [Halomonas ramblicola]MDN3523028.1 ester cyclase [Halomonas ramblicola]